MLLQVEVLGEVVNAFLATHSRRSGIFEAAFDADALHESTGEPQNVAAADEPEADAIDEALCRRIDEIQAHHIWLHFLLEAWQVLPLSNRCWIQSVLL